MSEYIFLILEVISVYIPMLIAVAYLTNAERKTLASMQRRLGPNVIGYYGLLQAFADALKLIIKEYVALTQSNLILFFLGPIITLFFSLIGFGVIPYGPYSWITDHKYGILIILALSSISTYGILLAGWSANSKFAFLGSIRSTAQLISYELLISSIILLIVIITDSLNLNVNVQIQKSVWFIFPLFPLAIIFLISIIAETNRAPFDLAEAESELVGGFMTEHAAVIFVFFFLAEYANMLLISAIMSLLLVGGYLVQMDYIYLFDIINEFLGGIDWIFSDEYKSVLKDLKWIDFLIDLILCPIVLGIKTSILLFIFVWVRASFPRTRFDQLMSFCWTILLPLLFGFLILEPCILYNFSAFCIELNVL